MQQMVSRGLGFFLLAAMALPAPAPAADDVVMKAMRDELDRSMKQLQLEQLEKPYFISYHVQDRTSLDTSATFGALLSGGLARARYLTVQVRVGRLSERQQQFHDLPARGQWADRKRPAPPRRRLPGIAPANLAGHRHGLQRGAGDAFPQARGAGESEGPREPSRLQQGASGDLARALFADQDGPCPSRSSGAKSLRPLPPIAGNLYLFGQPGGHRHPLLVPQ